MKYSKTVYTIAIIFPIGYILIILIFMLFIKCNLSYPVSWCPSLTKEGFDLFAEFFKVPLRMLWIGMVTYGIFIAAYNLYQAHKQFNESKNQFEKQFEMHQDNIYMNNYYKHQDEFIIYISNALINLELNKNQEMHYDFYSGKPYIIEIDHNKFKISNYIIMQIFKIWFGHLKDKNTELQINKSILKEVKKLYYDGQNLIEKSKENTQQKLILSDDLNSIIDKIGISKIKPTGQKWEDVSKIKITFTVCRAILEFDNQSIDNEQELYKLINI